MKNIVELFVLVSVAFVVSSCASYGSLQEYESRLASNEGVSMPFNKLSYAKLPLGKYLKDEFGKENLAYQFESGSKAFYLAYELPQATRKRIMEFTAAFSSIAGVYAHVVYPTFRLLDENYQLIDKYNLEMKFRDGGLSRPRGFVMTQTLPEKAKYLLVVADPEHLGKKLYYLYSYAAVGVGFYMDGSHDSYVPVGAGGPIEIRIFENEI